MRPGDELLGADFVEHCIEHREPEDSFTPNHFCRDISAETEPPDVSLLHAEDEGEAYQKEDVLVEHKEMERAANVDDDVSPVDCASPDSQRGAATPFWEAMNSECHDGLANKDSMSQQEVTIRLVANCRSNCTIA
ncbi:hypothetical protein MRX96_018677 [Rhipicephalus microplus]|uniref:uncharacterized protein LOC142761706 n=1 Tax=Rhipicephalus microplus TaxID=6941 RepID=UPI003F6BC3FB